MKRMKANSQLTIKQQNRSLMRSMMQAPATVYSNFGNSDAVIIGSKNIGTERLDANTKDNFFNPQSTINSFKPFAGCQTSTMTQGVFNKLKLSDPPSL